MNRRMLMSLLGGAILTPEGLWMPGKKTISLPPKIKIKTYSFWTPASGGDGVIHFLGPIDDYNIIMPKPRWLKYQKMMENLKCPSL